MSFSDGKADFATTGAVMHRNVDLTNFSNASLTFKLATSATGNTQIGVIQIDSDWVVIRADDLGPNGEYTFDLSSYSGITKIKFSNTGNGLAFSIDDISVTGTAN